MLNPVATLKALTRNPVFGTARQAWALLDASQRRGAGTVLALALGMALLETATIAGLGAFIRFAAEPSALASHAVAGWLQTLLGLTEPRHMLIALGVGVMVILIARNFFGLLELWYRVRYTYRTRQQIATRLLAYYLTRPYPYFLTSRSSDLTKNVNVEVNTFATTYIYSWMTLISDLIMATSILLMLVYFEPRLTLLSIVLVGATGSIIPWLTRRRLDRVGQRYREHLGLLFKTTNEAIGGIKEIKVLGREGYFISEHNRFGHVFANSSIRYALFSDGARFFLEMIVFTGLIGVIVFAIWRYDNYTSFAGTVALFAVALYRVMPIAHRLSFTFSSLKFNQSLLAGLSEGLAQGHWKHWQRHTPSTKLPFGEVITFNDVRFSYEGTQSTTVDGLSLSIKRNTTVAFVGPTGAGKTTVADLLIGLLSPTSGVISIDGLPLDDGNRRAWQMNVGYVPQTVYLVDDTIRRNIALGLAENEIDEAALQEAVRVSNVDEFTRSLPLGLETFVGERGVRLSGGQRQRIGIARAIYRKASLLVLDEATSALDGRTERIVEEALDRFAQHLTVVIIAHRLTTVRNCSVIHVMEGGRIAASGTYDELMAANARFRDMARVAE